MVSIGGNISVRSPVRHLMVERMRDESSGLYLLQSIQLYIEFELAMSPVR